MLELLYHKPNPLITNVLYDSIFKKLLRLQLRRKTLEKILFFLGHYNH